MMIRTHTLYGRRRDAGRVASALLALLLLLALPAQAQNPNWSVNPADFESNMSVTGLVVQGTQPASDANDLLAAFVDGEIRGVTGPVEVGGQYLFFITVYANDDGETVSFKTYEAGADVVRRVSETITFQSNAVQGTIGAPFLWNLGAADSGAPAWSVDPSRYAVSMTLTASLSLNGEAATMDDLLAAYVGDEVRGVSTVADVGGVVYFFLTIYANERGESITFEAYDASSGSILPVAQTMSFETNVSVGAIGAPLPLAAAGATGVERVSDEQPDAFQLGVNYPNPFNPQTVIPYALAQPVAVRLTIHDLLGRTVAVLADAVQPAGAYHARFDAAGLPSGLYLYRLQAGAYTTTRTMTLLR